MFDLQNPWLGVLSFGLAVLGSACFSSFLRQLLQAEAGSRPGQLLIDASAVAIGLSAAALVAGLAFAPAAALTVDRDWALLLIVPIIACTVLALQLASVRQTLGAAGALTASALMTPLAGVLASTSGSSWVASPAGMTSAALLSFSFLLPAIALLGQRPPTFWRDAAATLLLAIGWLLPQFLRLAQWPITTSATLVRADELALLVAFDALVVIGLFWLSRRLLGRAATVRLTRLAELRAANTDLASSRQALEDEKQASASAEARHCEQVLHSANVGVFDWDLASGKVSYRGTSASMLGEQVGQASLPLVQFCHPGELRLLQRLLRELSSGERERAHCELRLRSAEDVWRWMLVNIQTIEWLPDGSPSRVLGTQLDINRIKHVEHMLLAERSLFASGPVIILTFDGEAPHRLRQTSANLREALGHPDQRLSAGQPLDALLHPDDVAQLAELVMRAVSQPGAQAQGEMRLAKTDGSWPWYLLHVVAEPPNVGKLLRAYLVDINRLKEAESHAAGHNEALQEVVRKMSQTQHFMETLQQLTELLQLCESETESEQIIVQGGPQLFPRWSGALTFAGEGGLMTVAASWGEPFTAQQSDEADCWAVRRGRLHMNSADPAMHVLSPVCGHFGGGSALPPGIKHAICAPLLKSFDRPGVLHLIAHETMGEEDLRSAAWGAETFADALKLSLGNLRLRTSLREQAVHDEMTDLYNRRYFDEALNRELSRSQRTGEGLILAILDIDHFKNFNDTFGHEAGDKVLKEVAEQLRRFVRAYDIACRVGGEELAIIMPRVHIDEAFTRLNQLREEIGACALTHNGTPLSAVTVSIGVADLATGSPDDLLRRADTALYAAKNSGRNRVMRWAEDLDAGFTDRTGGPAAVPPASGQATPAEADLSYK